MTHHKILSFLKFGEEKHINELYNHGIIYMNPLNFFKKIEDNELRGDKYEGISKIWNYPSGESIIPSINHKIKYESIHVNQSYEYNLGNIYSMYCISSFGFPDPNSFYVDKKIKEFGSHFLMIKDIQRFLDLMEAHLTFLGYKFRHGFVEYYDKHIINGEITLFQKPKEFEYQKEFRFYVNSGLLSPLSIKIGSLKSIAEVHKIEMIHELRLS